MKVLPGYTLHRAIVPCIHIFLSFDTQIKVLHAVVSSHPPPPSPLPKQHLVLLMFDARD